MKFIIKAWGRYLDDKKDDIGENTLRRLREEVYLGKNTHRRYLEEEEKIPLEDMEKMI
jgi:hypothetical protein